MRTYDLTPFYRSTVGFDRFFNLLDQVTSDGSPGYPPYNIERTGENAYRISVAVSGFSQGELSIVANPAGGLAVMHAHISVPGVGKHATVVDTALGMVGRPVSTSWLGGAVVADLRSGAGIPEAAAQAAAHITHSRFYGQGPATCSRTTRTLLAVLPS